MVVGDMDDARLRAVVVATEEILLRPHAHVRSLSWNIGVKGEIVGNVVDRTLTPATGWNELRKRLAFRHALFARAA